MLPKVVPSNSSTKHRGMALLPPPLPSSSSSSSSSKTGMVLGARGARACDMCGKEKARWYCAADEAYLCERCDACVHSANAVARRHERQKLSLIGSPDQNQKNRKTKSKSNSNKKETNLTHQFKKVKPHEDMPLYTWIRAPRRKRSGRKRSNKACASGCFSVSQRLDSDNGLISIKHASPRDEEEEEEGEDGVLLHPPTPAALHRDIIVKCEPTSPASTYNQDSPSRQSINGRDSYGDGQLIKAELVGESNELADLEVPTYEPFFGEISAASNEELIRENLLSNAFLSSAPSSSAFSTQNTVLNNACPSSMASPSSAFAACSSSSIWASQLSTLICKVEASKDNSLDPRYCDDMELSCVIEDGSISIKDEGIGDADMGTFDVMNLCTQTNASSNTIEDDDPLLLREDFPDMEMQACCKSIFGGNPFKGKGESELDMDTSYMGSLGHEDPTSNYHYVDEHSHDQQQKESFVFVNQQLCAAEEPSMFSQKSLCLQLDYEDVLNAWSDRGSLWMDGQRPQVVPDLCFFYPGSIHTGIPAGEQAGRVPVMEGGGAAREARVLRYKEKRRTRLFSKKIRYEVRKLNAERRPRMKGRFVKKMHDH